MALFIRSEFVSFSSGSLLDYFYLYLQSSPLYYILWDRHTAHNTANLIVNYHLRIYITWSEPTFMPICYALQNVLVTTKAYLPLTLSLSLTKMVQLALQNVLILMIHNTASRRYWCVVWNSDTNVQVFVRPAHCLDSRTTTASQT